MSLNARRWGSGPRLLIAAVALAVLSVSPGVSQSPDWTAQLIVPPYPSPFVSEWERNPQVATLNVFYSGSDPVDFRIEGEARVGGVGVLGRAESEPYFLPGGPATRLLTSRDILDWRTLESNRGVMDDILRSGYLPEGRHQFCARVVDLSGVRLTEACADFTVALPDPPQLILPMSLGAVSPLQPVFQWTPVMAPPELGVMYQVRIVERYPGQTQLNALAANPIHHLAEVEGAPMLVYPMDGLPLEDGREYVWQVAVLDGSGQPLTSGARRSEIWSFVVGELGDGGGLVGGGLAALPDSLPLVPGVATLHGLGNAMVTTTRDAYVLDGTLRLELNAPFRATVQVEARGLEVEGASFAPATFRGGSVSGTLTEASLPEILSGPLASLSALSYSPSTGLVLGGSLRAPDGSDLELTGLVAITTAGLDGTLRAGSTGAEPLFSYGGDVVSYRVDSVSVEFPSQRLRIAGGLELFGGEASCVGVEANPIQPGVLGAVLDCRPGVRVPLVDGPSGLSLAVDSLGGSLSASWATGELSYDVALGGGLVLGTSGDSLRVGATLRATPAGVVLEDVALPDLALAPQQLDLGAVRLALTALDLTELSMDPVDGWDFVLRMDAELGFPMLDPAATVAVSGVTLDPSGLTLPAVRGNWSAVEPVELGGFLLRPLGFRMDSLRLAWLDAAFPADWGAGFDLELSFAAGAPEPLRPVRLLAQDAGYRNGRFTGALRAVDFQRAPLLLPLGGDSMALRVTRLEGAMGEDGEVTVTAAGSLVAPTFLRCDTQPSGDLPLPSASVAIGSRGSLTGTIEGLVPACPLQLGALTLRVLQGDLAFAVDAAGAAPAGAGSGGGAGQQVRLDVEAQAVLPGPDGTPVTATGALAVDLMGPRLLSGSIQLDEPFLWSLPAGPDPLLRTVVSEAVLDTAGLRLSGEGELRLGVAEDAGLAGASAGARATVSFQDLRLRLRDFQVTGGSASIHGSAALAATVDGGALRWRLEDALTQPDADSPFRFVLPDTVALEPGGLRLGGTAAAHLAVVGDTMELAVAFTDGFRLGLTPRVGVQAGRASIRAEQSEVAYVDSDGFWLGDVLALVSLPDRIGLPSETQAYLAVAENGAPRVAVASGPAGVRLHTRPGDPVSLVLPALAGEGEGPPSLDVEFDVVVDPATFQVRGGFVDVGGDGSSLLSFEEQGITFDVTALSYRSGDGGYALRAAAVAEVALGATSPVALTGELELVPGLVKGRIEASSSEPGGELFRLDAAPLELVVERAALVLPSAEYELDGRLRLFGDELGCESLEARSDGQGGLVASAACMPNLTLPLTPGTDRATLVVETLAGSLAVHPQQGLSGALDLAMRFRLDAAEDGGACGAAFDLHLSGEGVSYDPASVSSTCAGFQAPVGGDWLGGRLQNLALDRLSWTAAEGWDYALSLDIDLSVPGLVELPTVVGVSADPAGLHIPALDATLPTARVELAGLGLALTAVHLPAFDLSWNDWQVRAAGGFAPTFDASVSFPELPASTPECLATAEFGLSALTVSDGRLRAVVDPHTFGPACALPLGGEVAVEVEHLGGTLALSLDPLVVDSLPEIQGSLRLPSFFDCGQAPNPAVGITSALRLAPDGTLTGRASGLAMGCPIDLAAVRVEITESTLDFAAGPGGQELTLAGGATASFDVAGSPVHGTGSMVVDLLAGRMTAGSLSFPGPFTLDLPREQPVLSLGINLASLDTAGLHLDGRGDLQLGQATIGTTFDTVTINPVTMGLTAGRITFDQAFALEVGLDDTGGLDWGAVPTGSPVALSAGLRVDLPSTVALTPAGFQVRGDGAAGLVYEGQAVTALGATFSPDFALGLSPVGVSEGAVEFLLNGARIASIDRLGFHADLLYFGLAALPDRLPLPGVDVAYLELRDANGDLRVDVETTSDGIRIFTHSGGRVPLVFPALQLDRAAPPTLDVALDVALEPASLRIAHGAIHAAVPDGAAGFDLSSVGLPVSIDSIAYEAGATGYRFVLATQLALFGGSQGSARDLRLELDGTGRLAGAVALEGLGAQVELVPGFRDLLLTVDTVRGWFDARPGLGSLDYDLDLAGELALTLSAEERYSALATLRLTDTHLQVSRLVLDARAPTRYLELPGVTLGLGNLRVPQLGYDPGTGWDFELLFDLDMAFPELGGLGLPTLHDVALRSDGFTLPAWEVPALAQALDSVPTAELAGFLVEPTAFRMDSVRYDWFTGQVAGSWGFGFDLDLVFPEAAPEGLAGTRVQVLDAGLTDGRFTGMIEARDLGTSPIDLPLGGDSLALRITQLAGDLRDQDGVQQVDVTVGGTLILPAAMRCDGAPDTAALPASVLRLASDGRVSGTLQDFVPGCPVRMGPVALQVTRSSLEFRFEASAQQARLDLDGTVRLPAPTEGDSISAAGSLALDLVRPGIVDGFIEITEPFRWGLPQEGTPLFGFTVSQARLDTAGLTLSGAGSMELAASADAELGEGLVDAGASASGAVGVAFNDLTLRLPDFQVSGGSVTFTSAFALAAGLDASGAMQWRPVDPTSPDPAEGFKLALPDTLLLDRHGLRLGGSAAASLAFGDTTFTDIAVDFTRGFRLGFAPIGIAGGRVGFRVDTTEVAYADSTGFWPGDIFGILPVPARLGLPAEDVAYIRLRGDDDALLIETEGGPAGINLRTKEGQPAQLVLPSLAGDGDGASVPSLAVEFDIAVDPQTFRIVSGSVAVTTPDDEPALLSLAEFGLPLELRGVAYREVTVGSGDYQLLLDARASLPESLAGLDLTFRDLTLTASGLSGSAELGTVTDAYTPGLTPIRTVQLRPDTAASETGSSDSLRLEITGARVAFGAGQQEGVALSGALRSTFFAAPEDSVAAPLFFTASLTTAGLAVSVVPNDTLPIGEARFIPSTVGAATQPLWLTADADGVTLGASGVLTLPSVSAGFAVTVQDLRVGTAGVTLGALSMTGLEGPQSFELFGASFTLRDSVDAAGALVHPAMDMAYDAGVLAMTFSGEMELLDNITRFQGLKLSTDGTVRLAEASLISDTLPLVPNAVVLRELAIRDGQLQATGSVVLPAPLDGNGPQTLTFAIAPDGTMEGGGNLVLHNEVEGLGGDRTQIPAGVGTFHPRYVGLSLDFTDASSTALEVVADFYVRNEEGNRIKLGDIDGNVVRPGLSVGLDGALTWGSVVLADTFSLPHGPVRLRLDQVSAGTTGGGAFEIGFGGEMTLELEAVQGGLAFSDFAFTHDAGAMGIRAGRVTGSTLTVAEVLNLELTDFTYSSTPTTIQVASGAMPTGDTGAKPATEEVAVGSYVRFGGQLSVGTGGEGSLFGGGVDEFLLYQVADPQGGAPLTNLLVKGASLDIAGAVSMNGDLRFFQYADGFELAVGATASIADVAGVAVVGAIESRGADPLRMGMFVAADGLILPIIPVAPVLTVTGVGGGFFLNPRPEWLAVVRSAAGLGDSQASARIAQAAAAAGPADFAVLLYGAMTGIGPTPVVAGRVLLTLTDATLQVDGNMEVLNQGDRFRGDGSLIFGLNRAWGEGLLTLDMEYHPVLTGHGDLGFIINSEDSWMISGSATAEVANGLLRGEAHAFMGNPGFLLQVEVASNASLPIVTLERGDLQVWYYTPADVASHSWGAMGNLAVSWAPLGKDLGQIRAAMIAALISQGGGNPFFYGVAEASVSVLGETYPVSVWAKLGDGPAEAGLGRDPTMDQALADAERVADDMNAAREEAEQRMADATLRSDIILSEDELAAAYERARTCDVIEKMASGVVDFTTPASQQLQISLPDFLGGRDPCAAGFRALQDVEGRHALQPGEAAYLASYIDLITQESAPADTLDAFAWRDSADVRVAQIARQRPAVESQIAAVQAQLPPMTPHSQQSLPSGSPVAYQDAELVLVEAVGPDGEPIRQMVSGPSFQLDESAAGALESALEQERATIAARDAEIRTRIVELEGSLAAIRAVTTLQAPGSLLRYARLHSEARQAAERYFAAHTSQLLHKQDWVRGRADWLMGQKAGYTAMQQSKAQALRAAAYNAAGDPVWDGWTDLEALVLHRATKLSEWTADSTLAQETRAALQGSDYDQNVDLAAAMVPNLGELLFHDVGRAGLAALDQVATQEVAAVDAEAQSRIGEIHGSHASLSSSLDELYLVQAELTGTLHDLYDRYLTWRGDTTGVGQYVTRRDQLARALTVPEVTSVTVATTTTAYTAEIRAVWAGSHPEGTYDYLFGEVGAAAGSGVLSNGPTGAVGLFRYRTDRTSQPAGAALQVGVRGGAGFLGSARSSYGYSYLDHDGAQAVSGPTQVGSMDADYSAPTRPVVSFPGLATSATAAGTAAWAVSPGPIDVAWSATDPESGIAEFQYALGTTPGGTDVRSWTTAGGRTSLQIHDAPPMADRPIYVSVRALSGGGSASRYARWSQVGTSPALQLDVEPPTWDGVIGSGAAGDGTLLDQPIEGGSYVDIDATAYVPMDPACELTLPPFPGSIHLMAAPAGGVGWGGSLQGGPASLPGSYSTSGPSGETPSITLRRPAARDAGSGVRRYHWRVAITAPASYSASGWIQHSAEDFTHTGPPLDFAGEFHVAVVAEDHAGHFSEPLVHGPFHVDDPTAPVRPALCALQSGSGLAVVIDSAAADPETGISGYRSRVRTNAGTVVRDWGDMDWSPGTGARAIGAAGLTNGQRYKVDVRAVNPRGMVSRPVTSGPVMFDASAPSFPLLVDFQREGKWADVTLNLRPDASGIIAYQIAIGTTPDGVDVIAPQTHMAAAGQRTLRLSLPALDASVQYLYIRFRSINGAGLPSSITGSQVPKTGLTSSSGSTTSLTPTSSGSSYPKKK